MALNNRRASAQDKSYKLEAYITKVYAQFQVEGTATKKSWISKKAPEYKAHPPTDKSILLALDGEHKQLIKVRRAVNTR